MQEKRWCTRMEGDDIPIWSDEVGGAEQKDHEGRMERREPCLHLGEIESHQPEGHTDYESQERL